MKWGAPIAGIWLTVHSISGAADLKELIRNLEAEDFKQREEAVETIAAAADDDLDAVIRTLCDEKANWGPETHSRIPKILKAIFHRRVLGIGEPETGMTLRQYLEIRETGDITAIHPMLEKVEDGSPAAEAGLKQGDVIVSWAGKPIEGADCVIRLRRMIRQAGPGTGIQVQVRRFEIQAKSRLKGSGELREPVELVLGPARTNPSRPFIDEVYAGWLDRMHMEHGLPEKYATLTPTSE